MNLKKEAGSQDPGTEAENFTKELASRDDYGEKGKGQMGEEFHDYLEDSRTFGGDQTPSRHQQEMWKRFKEWIKNLFQKKREIGKEPPEGGHPLGPGALSEGDSGMKLPWFTEGTRMDVLLAPAMKRSELSPSDEIYRRCVYCGNNFPVEKLRIVEVTQPDFLVCDICFIQNEDEPVAKPYTNEDIKGEGPTLKKVAIDAYNDHHVDVTFEFLVDEIKIVCTWDKGDLPRGLDETQTLSRVVQFLEKKLPAAFARLEHATANDIDLVNRTLSILIPIGVK